MKTKQIETIKSYRFWGLELERHWTNFEKGLWMSLLIITFPIWIWLYLIYEAICFIGGLDGNEKLIERPKEKEEEKTYY